MPIHGLWHDGAFYLWGDRAPESLDALSTDALRAAVGELSPDALLGLTAGEATLNLWLPDSAGDWTRQSFPALRLSACDAVDLLTTLPPERSGMPPHQQSGPADFNGSGTPVSPTSAPHAAPLPTPSAIQSLDFIGLPGVASQTAVAPPPTAAPAADATVGPWTAAAPCDDPTPNIPARDTLAYWSTLARYVLRKIAQEQFFPDIVTRGEKLESLWRVLVASTADADHLEQFAAAMPPVCRAVVDGESDATALLESFIEAATDRLIRRFLTSDEFFAAFPQRTDLEKTPDVRWLGALVSNDPAIVAITADPNNSSDSDNPNNPENADDNYLVELATQWVRKLDQHRTAPPIQVRLTLVEPPDEPDAGTLAQLATIPDAPASTALTEDPKPRDRSPAEQSTQHSDDGEENTPKPPDRASTALAEINPSGPEPQQPHPTAIDPIPNPQSPLTDAPTPDSPSEDPEDDPTAAGWRLRIDILPLERDADPISLEELYDPATLETGVLSRNILEWRTKLQQEMQRATEFFPLAARAISDTRITSIPLNAGEAYAFIHQWATPLASRGFTVVLPEWATGREQELGLMLYLDEPRRDDDELEEFDAAGVKRNRQSISPGEFGLNTLLNFDWRVAIGELQIPTEQFKKLVEGGVPLVKFEGRWVQIAPEQAAKALTFLQSKTDTKLSLGEALRAAYAAPTDTGLPILGVSGVGTIRDFLDQAPQRQIADQAQPADFAGTLRPYQLRGVNWMRFLDSLGIGACLADDMGLGKTVQMIALLLTERAAPTAKSTETSPTPTDAPPKPRDRSPAEQSTPDQPIASSPNAQSPLTNSPTPHSPTPHSRIPSPGPTLLFAPTSVVGNWVREMERFAPNLRLLIHHGPTRLRGDAFVEAAQNSDAVITSYALAHRDANDLVRVPWHRIALDEAQKIKNPSAAATVAIRKLSAAKRIALTGTPVENHLSELWSIMDILNPGLLGSASDFRERFAVPIEKMHNPARAQQLRRLIQPFVLRRTKLDPHIVGDLPEKMENKVYCNLTPEQAALYEATTARMLAQIDEATGMRRRGLILGALTRLKQICDHPLLATEQIQPGTRADAHRSGKCERLIDMLEEVLDSGDAALIFTQYRQMGYLLEKMIADRLRQPVLFLHGGSSAKARNDMIDRFQAPGSDARIFVLSLRAGGLGLNLTAANHVFHFDRWWNPAVEAQATDRAHRIGQTKKVQVHKFICIGTLEERIDRLLADKLAVAGQIVTSGDQWLTNLSTDDLRRYLTLSDEAVAEVD
jgi:SNF2 family DNA or RNA helicase